MTVYIRQGGAWYATPNGRLRIKSGSGWAVANYCRIRINGAWYDSGYRGYPNPPTGFYVSTWDFSHVQMAWSGPAAGGAPVSYYRVVMTDAAGNWIEQYNTTNGFQRFVSVGQDGRYQFFVQAISASGLESAWNGPVRVQIGHTEQGYYAPQNNTREWVSAVTPVNLYHGASSGPAVPSNVEVWGMWCGIYSYAAWGYLSPGTNRAIYLVTAGSIRGDIGVLTLANPFDDHLFCSGNGAGNGWGLYAEGGGFTIYSSGSNNRVEGNMQVKGTETYTTYYYVLTRAYAGNSYW